VLVDREVLVEAPLDRAAPAARRRWRDGWRGSGRGAKRRSALIISAVIVPSREESSRP
jgi:hypothetical protein